jgi:hypothetical protein
MMYQKAPTGVEFFESFSRESHQANGQLSIRGPENLTCLPRSCSPSRRGASKGTAIACSPRRAGGAESSQWERGGMDKRNPVPRSKFSFGKPIEVLPYCTHLH